MIGKSLAHYEITELLGRGGMGEVYRAHDTKLGRDVALKFLSEEFARDGERLARFRREAKVLASLNHVNIAAIHGLEEAEGRVFLIMELAVGEDLSHRLARGPLAVDEVVSLAQQMAEGLEQAHERGVVHRDLKPANVMLSDDGAVKILDFGLARAYAGESPAEGQLENSPTITAAMTQVGTILGTAAYMSPEQARGREVDRRADIWAFGVILYEALTGVRLFEGESISDTLAGVLKTEPDFDSLPDSTPVALRWLIERCLQKQPSSRLRDIGEARILLQADLNQLPASSLSMSAMTGGEKPRFWLPMLVLVGLLAALAGAYGSHLLAGHPVPRPLIHAALMPPPGQTVDLRFGGHLALSPDGSRLAFVAEDSLGNRQLWVRRLDSAAAYQLTGTEDALYPFWSFDGTKIGFFSNGDLRKIDAAGGVATTVCPAAAGRGGTWTEDGRIVFAPAPTAGLSIVSSGGGAPRAVTSPDSTTASNRWPQVLPDGRHMLYTAGTRPPESVWSSIDDSTTSKTLLTGVYEARYFDGYLLFGRDNALWARPFDPDHGEFLGQETLLAESVRISTNFWGVAYSATDNGQLVYGVGRVSERSRVGIYDLQGNALDEFELENGFTNDLDLSADDRYLLLAIYPLGDDSVSDIWTRDLQRGTLSRVTNGEGADDPIWSPTQEAIAYSTGETMVIRSMSGARPILREFSAGADIVPHDWSQDGRFILASRATSGDREILVVPVDESEEPWTLVPGYHPVFSHDGLWVAYMSVETGHPQIYLREFRQDGSTWQVSSSPALMPRFGPRDDRLYYLKASDRALVSVPLRFTDRGPEFGVESDPVPTAIRRSRSTTSFWDLSQDGTRFVGFVDSSTPGKGQNEPLELVVGWQQLVNAPR